MKPLKFLSLFFLLTGFFAQAQTPSYYDLTFEVDSITNPYAASSVSHAYVRSKRGVDGVNTTPEADAIRASKIIRIVLVFSEDSPADLETREEYNMERWDNLILTYPEFFQEKTKYKNMCQCSSGAGGDAFKQVQGFYIYFKEPEKAVIKEEPKKAPEKIVAKEEPKKEPEKVVNQEKAKETSNGSTAEKAAGVGIVAITIAEPVTKAKEPAVQEKRVEKEVEDDVKEEVAEKPVKTTAKKTPAAKPRRASDPKACRPSFYGNGDQDLNDFFKDNIALSKKQKKAAKKLDSELRLQLHFDGSVKRVTFLCENKELKELIEGAVKNMNNWNASVRNGVTIKSEVRMKLKYSKSTKSIQASELTTSPKPNPKCKCLSDSDIF